jgi:hypothetical protein
MVATFEERPLERMAREPAEPMEIGAGRIGVDFGNAGSRGTVEALDQLEVEVDGTIAADVADGVTVGGGDKCATVPVFVVI